MTRLKEASPGCPRKDWGERLARASSLEPPREAPPGRAGSSYRKMNERRLIQANRRFSAEGATEDPVSIMSTTQDFYERSIKPLTTLG
jgi:hypothetical protein